MTALIRPAVLVIFVGLLSLGVLALRLAYSPNDDPESRLSQEVQRLRDATSCREEARQEAVREYLAQRITLAETIQQFQEWDHEWPDYSSIAQRAVAEKAMWESDEERHYEAIIHYVSFLILKRRPLELPQVLQRLEKDFRQLQAGKRTPSTTTTEHTEKSR